VQPSVASAAPVFWRATALRIASNPLAWAGLLGLVALSAWSRDLVVDQAMMLNLAAQFLDGRVLYIDVPDAHLPATPIVFSVPVLLARATGLPPILGFNLFVSAATALCALAGARLVAGRPAPGLALLLTGIAFLAQNDPLFGQRDSLFHTVWLTYLAARLALPRDAPRLELAVGLAAGFLTAVKPHFLAYAIVDEALLLLWTRSLRHPALIGAAVSGCSVVALLFAAFDWRAYIEIVQAAAAYYRIIGLPPATVLANMAQSPSLRAVFWLIAACLAWWGWRRRMPRLAILLLATALTTVPLILQQGQPRPYYYIGITLPALMMGVIAAAEALAGWTAPGGAVGAGRPAWRPLARPVRFGVALIVGVAGLWVMWGRDVGLAGLAWQRLRTGHPVFLYGRTAADPFIEDWRRRSRPGERYAVLDAQYGRVAFDPLVSAVRIGQPIYSRYNGVELGLLFALVDGDAPREAAACRGIAADLVFADAAWLYVRRDVPGWAKPGDFDDQLHSVPECAAAIDSRYAEADRFDRYVVYRHR